MKNTKKILSITLTLCLMVAVLLPMTSLPAQAVGEAWTGAVATAFAGGTGTEADPFQISTGAELAFLASSENSGTDYNDLYIKLTGDINLNNQPWTPIGTANNYFDGIFDGGGYEISGLYINAPDADGQGLFGNVFYGTVKNLAVSGSVTGGKDVGGVVGRNADDILNCSFSGSVTGQTNVGGVVGACDGGSVDNCYNTATITATGAGANVGGVVGLIGIGGLNNCYNLGTVSGVGENPTLGGVVGYASHSNISNSYYRAGSAATGAGHFVADPTQGGSITNVGTFDDASSAITLDTSITDNTGNETIATSLSNALNNGLEGDYKAWTVRAGVNDGYPVFDYNWSDYAVKPAVDGKISNAKELAWLIDNHGTDNIATYTLTANIDLGAHEWEPIGDPETPFSGTLDGGGYTISNLTIHSQGNYVGLFGYAVAVSEVKNLHLGGSTDITVNSPTGDTYVGSLVGYSKGTISGIDVGGALSISGDLGDGFDTLGGVAGQVHTADDVQMNAAVSITAVMNHDTDDYIGGLFGEATNLTNVRNYADITLDADFGDDGGSLGGMVGGVVGTAKQLLNTGDITLTGTGGAGIGGAGALVGYNNNGTIDDARNTGTFSATHSDTGTGVGAIAGRNAGTVANSENTGAVTGTERVGGIVGYNSGTVLDCTNTGTVEGDGNIGGVVGLSDSGSKIMGCMNNAAVSLTTTYVASKYAGGIAGESKGTIEYCYNMGNVSSSYENNTSAGGVVGHNSGSINNAYNVGAVSVDGSFSNVGGVAGENINNATVTNCYNIGAVTGNGGISLVGGLVGENAGTVTNGYSTGLLSAASEKTEVGGVVGDAQILSTITNCYYLEGSALHAVGGDDTATAPTFTAEQGGTFATPIDISVQPYTIEGITSLREALDVGAAVFNLTKLPDGAPAALWQSGSAYPTHGAPGIWTDDIKEQLQGNAYGQPLPMPMVTGQTVVSTVYTAADGAVLTSHSDAGIYENTLVTVQTETARGIYVTDFSIAQAPHHNVTIPVIVDAVDNALTLDLTPIVAPLGDGVTFEPPAGGGIDGNILGITNAQGSYEIKVKSTNYEDFTISVNVTRTDKTIPTLTASDLTVPYTGEAVTKDDFTKSSGGVAGDWTIESAPNLTAANSGIPVTLKFTPTGDAAATHEVNYITVTLNINKAKPEGAPTFATITSAGSTLADGGLNLGTLTGGTIHWDDVTSTEVVADRAYGWTFTPTDTANYEVLTGSHVFFTTPSSGGGATTPENVVDSEEPLTSDDFKELAESGDSLTVNGDDEIEAEFDTAALDAILDEAEGKTVEFIAKEADASDINDAQKIVVGDNLVLDLRVLVDGVEFTDFETGEVTISLPYTLAEGETAANLKVYYVDDEGKKTLIESSFVDGILTFKTNHFSLYMVVYEAMSFTDVLSGDWYYDAVLYAFESEIMTGTSDTEFAPNDNMTRAMVWTVLARMSGVDTDGGDPWYSVAQDWAVENEVSDGTNPDGNITREEFATMLYRYAAPENVTQQTMLGQFSDGESVSDWAVPAMEWAVAEGIISGMDDGTLNPQGEATRAQMATMLMRYLTAE